MVNSWRGRTAHELPLPVTFCWDRESVQWLFKHAYIAGECILTALRMTCSQWLLCTVVLRYCPSGTVWEKELHQLGTRTMSWSNPTVACQGTIMVFLWVYVYNSGVLVCNSSFCSERQNIVLRQQWTCDCNAQNRSRNKKRMKSPNGFGFRSGYYTTNGCGRHRRISVLKYSEQSMFAPSPSKEKLLGAGRQQINV